MKHKNKSRQSHHRFSGYKKASHSNYTRTHKINRDFIATLAPKYYIKLFPRLQGRTGWQTVKCLFHDDRNPSLRVSLNHGGFKCMACGISGDLLRFHMLRQQKTFNETIEELGLGEY